MQKISTLNIHYRQWLPWTIFTLMLSLSTLGLIGAILATGIVPVDASTYFQALEEMNNGRNPYGTPVDSQTIWQTIHTETTAIANGEMEINVDISPLAGPFIYPPTLLQLLSLLRITPAIFILLLALSMAGFSWLWLRMTGQHPWWLMFVVFSWDVFASFSGGNIEILLLAMTLLGAYWLGNGRSLLASPFIAFVVLIKPFYALFFAALGLLMLFNTKESWQAILRELAISAVASVALIAIAIWLWPAWLRPFAFDYLRDGLAHTWYVLPVAEQTPMSIWNRSFMQGLASLGVSALLAQILSLVAWLVVVGITIYQSQHKMLSLPLLIALSFVLLYWFRPVGWTLIFLDVVVLTAVWPQTKPKERKWLLGGAIGLAISHWLGLLLIPVMGWVRLFTVQSAEFPWETWLVFPVLWGVLLTAVRRTTPAQEPI